MCLSPPYSTGIYSKRGIHLLFQVTSDNTVLIFSFSPVANECCHKDSIRECNVQSFRSIFNFQFFYFLFVYNSSSVHVAVSSIVRRRANYLRYEAGQELSSAGWCWTHTHTHTQVNEGAVQCWVVLNHLRYVLHIVFCVRQQWVTMSVL